MKAVILIGGYSFLFALAVMSAGFVAFSRKAIYCALALVVTMLSLAGIFLLIQAPFVALIQVLVYAGAVMVLFLYVIMLINPRVIEQVTVVAITRRGWAAFAGAAFLLLVFGWGLSLWTTMAAAPPPRAVDVKEIATLLLTDYLLLFEVTSVLLLVAIIGAVLIARRHETE